MNISSESSNLSSRGSVTMRAVKIGITVALGISINYVNATMLHTFNKHQVLKTNPRYILFTHLVVNDMIQLTSSISILVSTYVLYRIQISVCLLLILPAIFTTENSPLNLACMAVECYIAVCYPLRHSQICTVKRTLVTICIIWVVSVLSILPDFLLTVVKEKAEFFHSLVFCERDSVFRSAYSLAKRDATHILFLVIVWLTIFYTYFRILFTAKAASSDAKKASNTILIHAFQLTLCMLTYVRRMLVHALSSLGLSPYDVAYASYVVVQILPRLITPIVYGLRDATFRRYLKKTMLCPVSISPQTMLGTIS